MKKYPEPGSDVLLNAVYEQVFKVEKLKAITDDLFTKLWILAVLCDDNKKKMADTIAPAIFYLKIYTQVL